MNRRIRCTQLAASLMALISLPLTSNAYAAPSLPGVFLHALQEFSTARSYENVSTSTSTSPKGLFIVVSKGVFIVVRTGTTNRAYLTDTTRTNNGPATTNETVIGAKHTCVRQSGQKAWTCTLPPMSSLLTSMSISAAALEAAAKVAHTTLTSAGTKSEQGQLCNGVVVDNGVEQTHETLWVSQATGFLVYATRLFLSGTTKQNTTTIASTMAWSHWNDPKLTVPNVGG